MSNVRRRNNLNTQLKFTEAEYTALVQMFAGGDISSRSKSELERFAVMLSRPTAFMHFGDKAFPQICETVRTLLIVRMSEEQNEQAKRESRLALVIAVVALLAGIVQAIVGLLQYMSPSPATVQAGQPQPASRSATIPSPPRVSTLPASAPPTSSSQLPKSTVPKPPTAVSGASK